MLALLATVALAEVLSADHVAIGVNPDGSLITSDRAVGLVWDPDGADGPLVREADWLVHGRPLELWSLSWTEGDARAWLANGPETPGPSLDWEGPFDTGALVWTRGWRADDSVEVEVLWEVPWGDDVAWSTITITNVGDATLSDAAVAKVVDPDPEWNRYGTAQTNNAGGDGVAVAGPVFGERALALAALDGYGRVCDFCLTAYALRTATAAASVGDATIGVGVDLGDLAPGESASVTFAYALGLDAVDAADLAVAAADDTDHDRDGVVDDCDDLDPTVGAGLPELPDGLDNDCDGSVDEGTARDDGDGDGYSELDGDCDDSDPDVHPGATASGVDADCDGLADNGWAPIVEGRACGCASSSGVPWFVLPLLLAIRRRRCA